MNIFSHISTIDIIGLVLALILMVALAEYVRRFRRNPVNITGHRKIFFTLSSVVIAFCLSALIYKMSTGGLNLSLEFTGGTMMEVGFSDKTMTQEKISEEIIAFSNELKAKNNVGLKHPVIQMISNDKSVSGSGSMRNITVTVNRKDGEVLEDNLNGITPAFSNHFGKAKLVKVNKTSPKEALLEFQIEEKEGMFGKSTPVTSEAGNTNVEKESFTRKEMGSAAKTGPNAGNETAQQAGTLYFMDEQAVADAVREYDADLNVSQVTVGNPVDTQKEEVLTYKPAIIRLVKEDKHNLSTEEVNTLVSRFNEKFGEVYMFKNESIGPSVGKELAQKALLAVLIGLVLQLLYISIRFNGQARYGIAADVALIHDVIFMFGVYALVGRELDSPFVAALLTVIGYSVMDSIIIFDRIRENLRLMPNETYEKIVNISVNQTMTRSINTLLTVLITLFCLYFFGGETLQNFAFALIVGCSVGAYSSIFIAAPLVVVIDEKVKAQKKELSERKRIEREELAKERMARSASKAKPEDAVGVPAVEKKSVAAKYKKRSKKRTSGPQE